MADCHIDSSSAYGRAALFYYVQGKDDPALAG